MKNLNKLMGLRFLLLLLSAMVLPQLASAQGFGNQLYELNGVLDRLFQEMLPLCTRLIDVGRAIAGFAALWYIGIRVWKSLAAAEPIDFFPLMRPFAIGLVLMGGMYPHLIALMNGVLQPTVVATRAMSQDSKKAILWSIEQQEKKVKAPPATGGQGAPSMEKYEQPNGANDEGSLSSSFSFFSIKSIIKVMISDFFGVIYSAASLCVNTMRTFYLIVLVIIGPLVFGLSVFDGFSHSMTEWFTRYINVFMWLPVSNIFGAITAKIIENMSALDQDFFSGTAYVVLMIISIVGYTTVPSVANYIVQAGGRDNMIQKFGGAMKVAATAAGRMINKK